MTQEHPSRRFLRVLVSTSASRRHRRRRVHFRLESGRSTVAVIGVRLAQNELPRLFLRIKARRLMTVSRIRRRFVNRFGPAPDRTGQQVSRLHLSVDRGLRRERVIGMKQKYCGNQHQTMAKYLGGTE